jgi:hypothetical protein
MPRCRWKYTGPQPIFWTMRRIRSFKLHGGLDSMPRPIRNETGKGTILAISHPREEAQLVAPRQLKIYHWKAELGRI